MTRLDSLPSLELQPRSLVELAAGELALTTDSRLVVKSGDGRLLDRFRGEAQAGLLVGPLNPANARAVREAVTWLRPQPLGLDCSTGLGDRLGLATPGHVRALRAAGAGLRPVFAQQSIREMQRTHRTPQEVLDDATWGVLAEGWREGYGADADHLKVPLDIDVCVAAGYTLYTFDPGAHVQSGAEGAGVASLRSDFLAGLPWPELDDDPARMAARYGGMRLELDTGDLVLEETAVLRAAAKYGRAVAHVAALYRHLESVATGPFEVEISVDETDTPTTPVEHAWVALELRRLGVTWVGMAPRFRGRFEKGVDYIGETAAFEADFALHAAVARRLGPYKLSLHSGSDKFAIYEAAVRQAGSLLHLKTAGTSYLEALRTIAALDPPLFQQIYQLSFERYPEDRASYHVSARLEAAPVPQSVAAGGETLLDDFHARQILHVTFGSVLDRFQGQIDTVLRSHREAYAANLEHHLGRHLAYFAKNRPSDHQPGT